MRGLYYGWTIVGVSMLIGGLVVGLTFSAFGLFVTPVSEEFGLSRADMNTALIIRNIGSAALAPLIGRLVDKMSTRIIMAAGAILFGLSFAALGLSQSLLLDIFILALPLSCGILAAGTLTTTVVVARWFNRQRARAMSLAAVGMSLGGVVVPPLIGMLILNFGWRSTMIIVGLSFGAILALLSLAMRERPGPGEKEDRHMPATAAEVVETTEAAATVEAPEAAVAVETPSTPRILTVKETLRFPGFWLIALGTGMLTATSQSLLISLVPMALEARFTMLQATALVSVISGAALGGKLLVVAFGDAFDRTLIMAGAATLSVIPYAGFLIGGSYGILMGSAVLSGLISGAIAPVSYAVLADRFGIASFGTIRGLSLPIGSIVGALFIRLVGEAYDRTGSYSLMFLFFMAMAILAAVMLFCVRYTRRAAEAGAAG